MAAHIEEHHKITWEEALKIADTSWENGGSKTVTAAAPADGCGVADQAEEEAEDDALVSGTAEFVEFDDLEMFE